MNSRMEVGAYATLLGASNAPTMIVTGVGEYSRSPTDNYTGATCFWYDKDQRPQTHTFDVKLLYVHPRHD